MNQKKELEKSILQRNELLAQKDSRIETLNRDNVEGDSDSLVCISWFSSEKRKHCEINKEIIQSNVRYHKSVNDVQLRIDELTKSRETFLKTIADKDSEILVLKVILKFALGNELICIQRLRMPFLEMPINNSSQRLNDN